MKLTALAKFLFLLFGIVFGLLVSGLSSKVEAAPGVNSLTCTPPPADREIAALARALNYDHRLIYEYVYYNIEHTPIYSSARGALGTYLDGVGTNIDQNVLFVALLRQSCIAANFRFGTMSFGAPDFANYLGTSTYAAELDEMLSDGGTPHCLLLTTTSTTCLSFPTATGAEIAAKVEVQRLWTEYTVAGTLYALDPSYKSYTKYDPINLAAAMGYDQTNFLASAKVGSSPATGLPVGVSSIQNLNSANIKNSLNLFTANLAAYIRTNHPSKSAKEIFGGRAINNQFYGASMPVGTSVLCTAIANCTSTANALEMVFTVSISDTETGTPGLVKTFYASEVSGKRLSLTYAGSVPTLWLDGVAIGSGTAASGSLQIYKVSASTPYGTTSTASGNVWVGGIHSIALMAGKIGPHRVARHQKAIRQALAAGHSATSEIVMGESLAAVVSAFVSQRSALADLISNMWESTNLGHYSIAVVAINSSSTPVFDAHARTSTVNSWIRTGHLALLGSNKNQGRARNNAGSTLEAAVFRQYLKIPAVSTVKLFDSSNASGIPFLMANSSNWASVRPLLTGWKVSTLDDMASFLTEEAASNPSIVVPKNGSVVVGTYTGNGYEGVTGSGIKMSLSSGQKGGYGASTVNSSLVGSITSSSVQWANAETQSPPPFSYDPINMLSGAYIYTHEDMKLGSAKFPFGLEFRRSYSSSDSASKTAMGYGWRHNFMVSAVVDSDLFAISADSNPFEALQAVVSHYVTSSLLKEEAPPVDNFVISSIVSTWFLDELVNNSITVSQESGIRKFIRIPTTTGGSEYIPPPGDGSSVTVDASKNITIADKFSNVMTFGPNGQITSWSDINQNKLQFTNGTFGPTKVCGVFVGTIAVRCIDFTYNASGQLTQVSDLAGGRSNVFAYDGAGNLVTRTDALGKVTTFQYQAGAPGLLTRFFYPNNPTTAFVTNTYDAFGRVMTQADAFGNVWTYLFANGYRSAEIDPNGGTRTYYFDKNGNLTLDVDQVGLRTIKTYDGVGRLASTTKPTGVAVSLTYGEKSNVVTKTTIPTPSSTLTPITEKWTYNGLSKPLTYIDPRGNTTSYSYDPKGNLLTVTQPPVAKTGVVGLVSPVTRTTYNPNGLPLTIVDPEGRVSAYTYDTASGKLDLLQEVKDQGVGRLNITTKYAYDAMGNVTAVTDPLNRVTNNVYDLERRLTQTTNAVGGIAKYTYDAIGQMTSEAVSTTSATVFATTTTAYDAAGRISQTTTPDGAFVATSYDVVGRPAVRTSSSGRRVSTNYDLASRITSIVDGVVGVLDPSITSNLGAVTRQTRTYYSNGRFATMADGKGNAFRFKYDGFDRQVQIDYPGDTTAVPDREFHYVDSAGNETQWERRDGKLVNYTYDALNRLVSKAPTGQATITYEYDYSGRLLCAKASTDASCHSYGYDTSGRKVSEVSPSFGTITAPLDLVGNRTSLASNGYTYDAANRLTGVYNGSVATGTRVQGLTYDFASRRTGANFGSAATPVLTSTMAYSAGSQLSSLTHNTASGSVNYLLAYNQDRQRKSLNITDNTFLPAGLAAENKAYSSNIHNQYTAITGATLTYDKNGNLTSDGTWSYAYDTEGHLLSASKVGTTVTFQYDPFGRRKFKTVNGSVVTGFASYGHQEVTEYQGSSGAAIPWTKRFIYGAGLDEPVAFRDPSGNVFYHLADPQGSIIALTNSLGQIVEKHGYTGYGLSTNIQANNAPYQYAGRRLDQETGLYYNRARYYAPALGRFLNPDPIFIKDGLNLYAYTGNDPVNRTDPFGNLGIVVGGGIAADLGLTDLVAQAGGQASSNYAFLVNTENWSWTDPFNLSFSASTLITYGGTAGYLGSNPPVFTDGAPGNYANLTSGGYVIGGSVGGGFLLGFTDANRPSELSGQSGTANFNAGLGPLQAAVSVSQSSSASLYSISPPGAGLTYGLSYSLYNTYTDIGSSYSTK